MKKKVIYLITSIFVLMMIFSNFNVLDKTFANNIKGVYPNEISNEDKTRVDIQGSDFEYGCDAFIYDDEGYVIPLADLEYVSNNVISATVPAGLDNGLYSVMVANMSDDFKTIIPNAIRITGDNVNLRIKSITKEQIVEGLSYHVSTNIPVKAQIKVGTDSTDMKVQIRKKKYSDYHILPAKFLTEKKVSYVVNEIVVRSYDGQEIKRKFVEKWGRHGVKIDEPDLTDSINVEYDIENGTAKVNVTTNKSAKITLKKGVFYNTMSVYQTSESHETENNFELSDLIEGNTYFIEVIGVTKANKYSREKFDKKYKFIFNPTTFNDYEDEDEIITNDELQITNERDTSVDDELQIEDEEGASEEDIEEVEEDTKDEMDYSDFDKDIIWGIPYVDALIEEGVINKGNHKFDPRRLLTRKEMILMLQRAMNFELLEDSPAYFTDVPKNDDAYKPLAVMVEKGVTKGYGDGTFGLDDPITRIDAVTMLVRAKGVDLIDVDKIDFKDIEKDNPLLVYVETAYNEGWIDNEDGLFRPKDFLKRVEGAKWLATAFDLVDSIDFDKYEKQITDSEKEYTEEESNDEEDNEKPQIIEEEGNVDDGESDEQTQVTEEDASDDLMDLLDDLL